MTDAERMVALETTVGHLREDVKDMCKSLDDIERHITVLVTQRDDAQKRLSTWKTAGLTVCSALTITLIGWLAHIALVVQAAHVQP